MNKKGLFSFFKGKENDVVSTESNTGNVDQKLVDGAKDLLQGILNRCNFDGAVSAHVEEDNLIRLDIEETEDTGRIIGREGNTVESLQILLKAMMFKQFNERVKIGVDAGGYKQKRMDKAQNAALKAAQFINKENSKKELNPMPASERRAIHILFKEHDELMSYSVGEGASSTRCNRTSRRNHCLISPPLRPLPHLELVALASYDSLVMLLTP